jgi:pimeloyl-ACP methyl ester carboxylesterase
MARTYALLLLLAALVLACARAAPDPQQRWLTQRLDHFDPSDSNHWSQQYFINTTWYRPGGPIFVNIGGEGPASPLDVNHFQESNYAQDFGAMLVALEHRFYGLSQPTGDLTTESLKLLSSEQALADLAYFITELKQMYSANNAPVIVFGCSYSGALAAWFRQKYPNIAIAAVAGSAPVLATPDFYQYLDDVDQAIGNWSGLSCDTLIANATAQIQSLIRTPAGVSTVNKLFSLCTPLNTTNWLDVATFMSTLMGNWQGVAQYNDDNRSPPPPTTLSALCDIMEANPTTPLQTYANISNYFLKLQNISCLDPTYAGTMQDLLNTTLPNDSARQWVYQTCVEFGYFQTTDNANQPFGNLVPAQYYIQMCKDAFDIDFTTDTTVQTNILYGGNNYSLSGPSEIFFVNGAGDPWHMLSITPQLAQGNPHLYTVLIGNEAAHCSNEYPTSLGDSPSLVAARAAIKAQIGAWLQAAQRA